MLQTLPPYTCTAAGLSQQLVAEPEQLDSNLRASLRKPLPSALEHDVIDTIKDNLGA